MAVARGHSGGSQEELSRHYDATSEAGNRKRADPDFMAAVRDTISHLDSHPPVQPMSQAEFLERHPSPPAPG
jgi:hypothetical protein